MKNRTRGIHPELSLLCKKVLLFFKIYRSIQYAGMYSTHVHKFFTQILNVIFIIKQRRMLSYLQNTPIYFSVYPLPQPRTLAFSSRSCSPLRPSPSLSALSLRVAASPPFLPLRQPRSPLPTGAPPAFCRRSLPLDPDPARVWLGGRGGDLG